MSKSPRHRRPLIEALEPRLLFSATADIAVFDDGASDGQYLAQAAARTDLVSIYMPSDPVMMESQTFDGDPQADLAPSETPTVTTLVFVDTAVDNYETLVDDIRARVDANSVAIVYLDSSKEGLDQISDYLAGASGISAIHIISHGVAGNLQLGNQVLNENNINQFKEQLTGWQTALGADADILLYGCDLAANQSGVNFLGELSELTGADVAASNDLTGNSRADADWVLEERIGIVETESLFAANEPMAWQGVLADIVHLNSGAPTNEERIPTGSDIKQGIQLTSSQTVDRVQITLANHGTASSSVIMTVHESTYDGPVIATASVNTASLGGTLGTVNFDFSAVTFNAYTIYWVEFRTNDAADNLVGLGYINSNVITSEFVVNNVGDSSRDMSIAIIDVQNQAPTVANAIPNQNATEDSAFNFQFAANTFADVDVGNTLTYTAQLAGGGALPAWLSFDAATRTFSGTPLNANVGTVAIDVIANDGNGGTVTDTFDIVVANVNDAPTVSIALTDYYTNEQTAVNLHGTGITVNDVDSNTVTVTIAGPAPHSQLTADVGTTGATISSGNGTPSLVITGTLNQVNDFLAGNNGGTLTYRLAGDTPSATATLTITANDGALSGNDTATINITALNDAPVNTVPGAQATDEDTALVFSAGNGNQIQVDDVDEGAGDLEVTLSVTNGTLTLAGVAGLVFTTGDGTSDSSMVFRGTQADINTALATLTFAPTANYNGAAVLSITTSDLGNTGTGGVLTDTDNVNITVNAINDAPVNTVPGAQVTNKNVPITFSAGNSNQIQIADIDAGAATNIEVTLSVSNGVLTLAQTTNLTMVTGDGTADSTLVFRGTVADLNAALATLTFTPANNYTGGDTLSITTKDQGNTGAGGILMDQDLVGITINNNQVPTVSNAIPNQNATEDAPFSFQFAANTFADGDVGDTLTYTAQLAGGGALPAWLSFNAATRTFSGTPTNAFVGTVSIDVIADDGNGGTVTDTFDIVVANTNDAPTIANAIPNQNATEDAAFSFQFAANVFADSDVGDTLTYTAQLAGGGAIPAWLSFDPATRTFSGTPLNANVGTVSIDVVADDGNGGTVTDTFDIVVANSNDAPTIANAIPNQNATEDAAFNFQFAANTFADVDVGDTVTYTAQLAGGGAIPAWLSFDPVTRTFSGTPLNANVGTVSIDVIADDGNGGTVTDTFDIVVANSNDAPTVANAIPNQNATEDAAFNFQFAANSFADTDVGDTLTYTAQLAGGGALPAWLSFDPVTRTFSGTPTNAFVGTVSIDVIADDGNGGTVTDTFDIVVANTNDAPTIANAIPNQNATEDAAFNFQFALNTFADVDVGDTLTYTAQLAGGGALPAWLSFDAATRTFSGTPVNGDVGTISIDVTAADGNGGTVTDTFDIVITNTNGAPTVANAISDQNATQSLAFNFQFAANTFADADVGDTLTYSAQLNGGGALPAWLGFNTATRTFSGIPANGDVGVITIDVTADDGNGGTVTDTFTLTIADANDVPTVANAIPNQNATEEVSFNFQFAANTFADSDLGDTLTYSAQLAGGGALPAWISFDPVTRTFSGTPGNADEGTLSIDVIANDGNGGTVTDTFTIAVANTNDAPTLANPIPDRTATEDAAFNFQFAANTFADADVGASLTYSAQLAGGGALPAWLSFNAATRTFSGTPTSTDLGTLTIAVTASDGLGGTVTETFDILVANTNDAPTVVFPIADQNATENSAFSFTFGANVFADEDAGDTLTFSAQLAGGAPLPAWLSFDAVTRTFSGTPANGDVGVIDVQVTVSDSNGGTVSDRFTITVANTNDAPLVANAIPHQNATEGTTFNFQFNNNTFVDEDPGTNLTYNAQLADGGALPVWLSFDAATRTFSGTPAQGDTGNLVIHIIASDSIATVTAQFQLVVVAVNDVPQTTGSVVIDNLEDAAGDQVDLWGTFSDQETASRDLAFSIVGNSNPTLVSGASIDPATGKLQLRYGVNQFGNADLVVRAQDQQGAWVETLVRVNIESVNDVPVSSGITDIKVQAGAAPQQINVQSAFNDVENGRALAWTLVENSNSAVATSVQIDPATGLMTLAFSSQSGGDSTITLRSQDSDGAWVETRFKVTVTPAEVLPPPVSPPVTPPVEAPVPPMVPPAIPPTVPPTAEVPDGAGNGTDELPNLGGNDGTGITPPGIAGQPLAVDTGDSERPESGYKDKSSRDIERAEEMLSGDNIPLTTLTASTNLASLIALDAGFTPWEAADFDNEVRRLRAQMDEAMLEEQDRKAVVAGITFSVTTGLLVWSLRASSLLLTMMSMLPLWRGLDPLPILDEVNKKKKELEQQRKDREREDKSAKEVGYLFDHAQRKEPRR